MNYVLFSLLPLCLNTDSAVSGGRKQGHEDYNNISAMNLIDLIYLIFWGEGNNWQWKRKHEPTENKAPSRNDSNKRAGRWKAAVCARLSLSLTK